MTFDDDSVFLETPAGRRIVTCHTLSLQWPPPENVMVNGVAYKRVSLSSLTDAQRDGMTHVMRGALYKPMERKP